MGRYAGKKNASQAGMIKAVILVMVVLFTLLLLGSQFGNSSDQANFMNAAIIVGAFTGMFIVVAGLAMVFYSK